MIREWAARKTGSVKYDSTFSSRPVSFVFSPSQIWATERSCVRNNDVLTGGVAVFWTRTVALSNSFGIVKNKNAHVLVTNKMNKCALLCFCCDDVMAALFVPHYNVNPHNDLVSQEKLLSQYLLYTPIVDID